MLQSPKTKTLADKLTERISSMLDEIKSKTMHKDEEGDGWRIKRSKTLSQLKPVKNISKNLQSFLEISSMQKEAPESFRIKGG